MSEQTPENPGTDQPENPATEQPADDPATPNLGDEPTA